MEHQFYFIDIQGKRHYVSTWSNVPSSKRPFLFCQFSCTYFFPDRITKSCICLLFRKCLYHTEIPCNHYYLRCRECKEEEIKVSIIN